MYNPLVETFREYPDGWREVHFRDGTQQWYINPVSQHFLFIERVVSPKSRRKRWVVVSRDGARADQLYPPKACGPFPNLESAKAAYLVIINSR